MTRVIEYDGPAHHDASSDTLNITFVPGVDTTPTPLSRFLSVGKTATGEAATLTLQNASKYLKGIKDFGKIEVGKRRFTRTSRRVNTALFQAGLLATYHPDIYQTLDGPSSNISSEIDDTDDFDELLRLSQSQKPHSLYFPDEDTAETVFSEARTIGTEQLNPNLAISRSFTGSIARMRISNASSFFRGVRDFSKDEVDANEWAIKKSKLVETTQLIVKADVLQPGIVAEAYNLYATDKMAADQLSAADAVKFWENKLPGVNLTTNSLFLDWAHSFGQIHYRELGTAVINHLQRVINSREDANSDQ